MSSENRIGGSARSGGFRQVFPALGVYTDDMQELLKRSGDSSPL